MLKDNCKSTLERFSRADEQHRQGQGLRVSQAVTRTKIISKVCSNKQDASLLLRVMLFINDKIFMF